MLCKYVQLYIFTCTYVGCLIEKKNNNKRKKKKGVVMLWINMAERPANRSRGREVKTRFIVKCGVGEGGRQETGEN